ncbi:TorF family putative porin [Candidatus Phycosocius spiralis]|uniref:Uncharacterized protein n=1 Tax=Candidatus Phycosocius spiralis TaxID=2815099 RepID=A0ABQ4PTP3_9PROT|nr:TorF family putative porin [Candidatus Phycosocius spiralis]GIU66355.1 hypothetical protein PsB1_0509 [Candidatus Phycosocius spiralis]
MKLKELLLVTALLSGTPAVAMAQEATTSVNLGAASSYQFRGVNQNVDNSGQVFGGVDVSTNSFYVGTWFSNVNFDSTSKLLDLINESGVDLDALNEIIDVNSLIGGGSKANLEVDIYGGFRPTIGNFTLDFGLLAYTYPQEPDLLVYEGKFATTYTTKSGIALTGSAFYSPNNGKDGPSTWYLEAAASAPIPQVKLGPFSLSVNASYGNYRSDTKVLQLIPDELIEFVPQEILDILPGSSYNNWKIGLTAATEKGWAVDLFYTDTDLNDLKLFGVETYESRVVLQLKKSF